MSRATILKAMLGFVLFLVLVPAILFWAAGSLNWPEAWVYIALLLISTLISRVIIWKRSPELIRERANFTRTEGVPAADRILTLTSVILGPIFLMATAGLDHRFHWSPTLPIFWRAGAALMMTVGYAFAVWAMIANPYFSAVVRIQQDRGQVVITNGPYRFVRHPAYGGALLGNLTLPFLLNSYWALIPTLVLMAILVVRTRLEDDLLLTGLAGYQEFAKTTRYRLIPGIW